MLIDTPVNRITHEILAAAIEVHRILGPGLFERVYEPCFHYELGVRKLQFETQRVVPTLYKGMRFGATYRVDLIVEGSIVVETKCVEALLPVHRAQVLTYMKLTSSFRAADQLQRSQVNGWREASSAAWPQTH